MELCEMTPDDWPAIREIYLQSIEAGDTIEAESFWILQGGIFPENIASIRAHERVGFRVVGTRERMARFHDGRWRDTVIMERRSTVTELD